MICTSLVSLGLLDSRSNIRPLWNREKNLVFLRFFLENKLIYVKFLYIPIKFLRSQGGLKI